MKQARPAAGPAARWASSARTAGPLRPPHRGPVPRPHELAARRRRSGRASPEAGAPAPPPGCAARRAAPPEPRAPRPHRPATRSDRVVREPLRGPSRSAGASRRCGARSGRAPERAPDRAAGDDRSAGRRSRAPWRTVRARRRFQQLPGASDRRPRARRPRLDPRRRGGCPRSRGSGARRRRRTPRTWPGPVRRPHDPLPSPAVRPHPRRWREARASPPRAPARGPRAHPQANRAPGAEPVASRSGAVEVRAGVPELPAPGRRPNGRPPTRLRPPPRRRRRRAQCGGPTSAHPERWGSARPARGLQGVWPEAAGPGQEAAAGCRPSACPWRRRGRPSSPRPLDGARHGPDHAAPSPRPSWLRALTSSAPAARCGPPGPAGAAVACGWVVPGASGAGGRAGCEGAGET